MYHKGNQQTNTEFIALSTIQVCSRSVNWSNHSPGSPHPWESFIFTQRIIGTHVLLCFCIKQAETAKTWKLWAENFVQNQYGSKVKTSPFEFHHSSAVLWWIDCLWWTDFVLASPNGFIQEVCVVYLLSLVKVWVKRPAQDGFFSPAPAKICYLLLPAKARR